MDPIVFRFSFSFVKTIKTFLFFHDYLHSDIKIILLNRRTVYLVKVRVFCLMICPFIQLINPLDTSMCVSQNRNQSVNAKYVLDYLPRMLSFPTCITCLTCLRAYVLYVLTLPYVSAFLRVFVFFQMPLVISFFLCVRYFHFLRTLRAFNFSRDLLAFIFLCAYVLSSFYVPQVSSFFYVSYVL